LESSLYFQKLLLLILVLSVSVPVSAQDSEPIPIRFAGRIQSVASGTLFIDQIRIDTTSASINAALQNGNIIVVDGLLRADGTISARALLTYVAPENTQQPQTVVPPVPQTPSTVVIEGTVQAIDKDIVTVNDQQIQFPHHHPLLTTIQVGDSLRVEGNYTQTKKGPVFEVTQATVTARLQDNSGDKPDNGNNDNRQGVGKGMGG
jgi:hypothetical protein